jgi:predicted ribosomally synthesized peptide with SipW-like signal peptide
MSKKTKRYLMLLVAVGLIAVAAGGSGTFASFSAETANNGNYFATGTLFLHNTKGGGGTTCTSESSSDNGLTVAPASCDVLFQQASALPGVATTAKLQLTNAGSLDATALKFSLGATGCTNGVPVIATLNTPIGINDSVASLDLVNLNQTLVANTKIKLTDTDGSQQFLVTTTTSPSGGGASVPVTIVGGGNATHNYTTSAVVTLEGSFFGSPSLCSELQFNIVETDSSYSSPVECSFGTPNSPDCAFDSNFTLGGAPPPTSTGIGSALRPLTIASVVNGNAANKLSAGKSRYFLVGVKAPSTLSNTAQNDKVTFDLRWHIDQ